MKLAKSLDDVSKLSSGIYIVKLKSEDFIMIIFQKTESQSFGCDISLPSLYAEVKNVGSISIETSNQLSMDLTDALVDSFDVSASRIYITACGTSWHAGLIGKHLIEGYAQVPVHVEYASEFRYRNAIIDSETILIAISQSGETADTLAAIKMAKQSH